MMLLLTRRVITEFVRSLIVPQSSRGGTSASRKLRLASSRFCEDRETRLWLKSERAPTPSIRFWIALWYACNVRGGV